MQSERPSAGQACLHVGRQFLVQEDPGAAGDGCSLAFRQGFGVTLYKESGVGIAGSPSSSAPESGGQPVAIIRSLAESVDNVEKVLVLAQDIHSSGVELRCEVYIANIHRIEVETSVRRINVDDVETLGVKAYDKQGNVFSSLEGLQFRWRIGDESILQRPKLVDSAFKLSPVRRALAEAGADPDTVLLRGVATGRTTVGANLTVAGMRHVISPDVPLTVLENIVLLPSLMRAPPMAHLQLQLKVLRGPRRPLEEWQLWIRKAWMISAICSDGKQVPTL
ncbi:GB210 [Symbiodinium microadriaticum]|nr:GB210 [Symbiodinium microadriaticum]CAE7949509.1 GB210 [Symbiodinium sp. KB8]